MHMIRYYKLRGTVAESLDENNPFVIDILIEECEQEYERRQLSNESGESESEESKSENVKMMISEICQKYPLCSE